MLQLHYHPSTAAMAPHILLQELGVPFELVLVDRTTNAHKAPAYLQLNPNGLIPVLTDGDLVLYEAAAICLYLCDTYPQGGLAPAVGTVARAHFYKWLVWLTNTLQATLLAYFYPERWVNPGNAAGAAEVKAQAERRVGELLDQLDAELARHGGPWLLGQNYSALDAYAMMLCRWTRGFASAPARARPHLGPYLQAVLARPAVQRVFATEKLAQPWV
jgi:glutathione S-transferase